MTSLVGHDDFSHSHQPVRGWEFFWMNDNVSCLSVNNVISISQKRTVKRLSISLNIKHDQCTFQRKAICSLCSWWLPSACFIEFLPSFDRSVPLYTDWREFISFSHSHNPNYIQLTCPPQTSRIRAYCVKILFFFIWLSAFRRFRYCRRQSQVLLMPKLRPLGKRLQD